MGAFGKDCPRGDNTIAFHATIVHNYTSHTDQHIILYGTPMHNGIVSNGNVIAYRGRGFLIGTVHYGPVLYIYPIAHFYIMDIAPQYGIEPNTTFISHTDIAHNSSIFGNKAILAHLGRSAIDSLYDHI